MMDSLINDEQSMMNASKSLMDQSTCLLHDAECLVELETMFTGMRSSRNCQVWVQCEKCSKWRMLVKVTETRKVPKPWVCFMNETHSPMSTCVSPEWPPNMYNFTLNTWSVLDTDLQRTIQIVNKHYRFLGGAWTLRNEPDLNNRLLPYNIVSTDILNEPFFVFSPTDGHIELCIMPLSTSLEESNLSNYRGHDYQMSDIMSYVETKVWKYGGNGRDYLQFGNKCSGTERGGTFLHRSNKCKGVKRSSVKMISQYKHKDILSMKDIGKKTKSFVDSCVDHVERVILPKIMTAAEYRNVTQQHSEVWKDINDMSNKYEQVERVRMFPSILYPGKKNVLYSSSTIGCSRTTDFHIDVQNATHEHGAAPDVHQSLTNCQELAFVVHVKEENGIRPYLIPQHYGAMTFFRGGTHLHGTIHMDVYRHLLSQSGMTDNLPFVSIDTEEYTSTKTVTEWHKYTRKFWSAYTKRHLYDVAWEYRACTLMLSLCGRDLRFYKIKFGKGNGQLAEDRKKEDEYSLSERLVYRRLFPRGNPYLNMIK